MQLASLISELGQPVAQRTRNPIPAMAMVVASAGLLATAIVFWRRLPPIALHWILALPFALAIAGIQSLWRYFRWDEWRICPRGVVILGRDRIESFRWSEVDEVRFEVPRHHIFPLNSAIVKRPDGSSLTIRGISSPFVQYIGAHIARAQLPTALADLDAGREVPFGECAITPEGVRDREGVVPWIEIEDLDLREPVTLIRDRKPRLALPRLPNLHLFIGLVRDRLTRGRFMTRGEMQDVLGREE